MATLLDAYALIAFVKGEAAADQVELLMRTDAAITSVNLAECVDRFLRVDRFDEAHVHDILERLVGQALAVLAFSESHAWRAATLRARHYHRRRSPLSLADCVLLAAAGAGDAVATADRAVLRVAESEGIASFALPTR